MDQRPRKTRLAIDSATLLFTHWLRLNTFIVAELPDVNLQWLPVTLSFTPTPTQHSEVYFSSVSDDCHYLDYYIFDQDQQIMYHGQKLESSTFKTTLTQFMYHYPDTPLIDDQDQLITVENPPSNS